MTRGRAWRKKISILSESKPSLSLQKGCLKKERFST